MENDVKYCFLPGTNRICSHICTAYVESGKTHCRLLNAVDSLSFRPSRPTAPFPPKVDK